MSVVRIPKTLLDQIRHAAEAAYPAECCGILVGSGCIGDGIAISRIVESANLAAEQRNDRFEVDPMVRFEVMRELEGTDEEIVGHYHSHPDHPAEPSATDLEMAFEPELAWIIASVTNGKVSDIRAHRLRPEADGFDSMTLVS